jgi:hypothetical protein
MMDRKCRVRILALRDVDYKFPSYDISMMTDFKSVAKKRGHLTGLLKYAVNFWKICMTLKFRQEKRTNAPEAVLSVDFT